MCSLLEDIFSVIGIVECVWIDCIIDIVMAKFGFGYVIEVGERFGVFFEGVGFDLVMNMGISICYKIIISCGIIS